MYLRQLVLNEDVTIEYAEQVLSDSDVQLKFKNIETFYKAFDKFSALLYDYSIRIKSLYAPYSGAIFEDTVKIMSILEDALEININHIVVEADNHEDIKQLIEFYYEDLMDGSLDIGIQIMNYHACDVFKSPIEIIAYIERRALVGVSICLDVYDDYAQYIYQQNFRLNNSILPYVSAVYHPGEPEMWEKEKIFLITD